MAPTDLKPGDRVQLHPSHDLWMAGDRYGTVVKLGRIYIYVRLDRSDRVYMFRPERLEQVQ